MMPGSMLENAHPQSHLILAATQEGLSDHCYTLITQTKAEYTVGALCICVAQENELLGSFGVVG